ncbi:MAG: peptidase [Sphingobacteriaceae bacterium]|jgi:predicted metalloprotease with PDZ domain|nr:peptidase [Sphingobacteriaceae bacterium]
MKTLLSIFSLIASALFSVAQTTIQYEISFPNAVHHEAEVSLLVPQVPAGALTVRMSRSSPGRYATHEFGKNVYSVKAFDSKGKELQVEQTEGDVYKIAKHDGSVKVTYTIFGNYVDGTYLAIDETHAHMNMPATFMWAVGMDARPIQLKINDTDKYGWKVATQLKPSGPTGVFTAPSFQYFMDSPIELSDYKMKQWSDVNTNGKTQQLALSSHTSDTQETVDAFASTVRRMTAEAKAVFGELAPYDFGSYVFLHDVNPTNNGDGMEHRNSTVITQSAEKIAGNEKRLISTFSHEFFHSWNVERIRPKTLEPFNFAHSNMSNELWFAEGFTQYYGELVLKRAGIRDLDTYCGTLSGMLNYVLNAPGAAAYSAPQMSRHAVFSDAGVAVDQNNDANIFTSYYYYGAVIALALDHHLRTEFKLTLDDYMRAVWKAHGKTEISYTIPDLQNVLAKLTNTKFASEFFSKYVYGTQKNNYEQLLKSAGLVLRKASAGKASLGTLRLSPEGERLMVSSNTLKGTPAYESGIDNGDYLLKIGGKELKAAADVRTIVEGYNPGDEIEVTYQHKGLEKTRKVKLQENNALEVVPIEKTGGTLTPQMALYRSNWLDTKVK